jgi:hypothetical protein
MLSDYDFEIALAAWLASIGASFAFPAAMFLVIGTTFNLYHQRRTLYEAGREFTARVRDALSSDLGKFEDRLKSVEKSARDTKDALALAGQMQSIATRGGRGF